MTKTERCSRTDRAELAEQYIARRLSAATESAFEDHFVNCDACRREVELCSVVRGELARTVADPRNTRAWTQRRRVRGWGITVALAAGMGTVMLLWPRSPDDARALGALAEPPTYLGIAVRDDSAPPDSIFVRAMNAYAARRFDQTATGLVAALKAGEDSVPAEFFLGASRLMTDDPRGALDAFSRVIARGDTPYRAEARLLAAKALLRLDRSSEALKMLREGTPHDAALASRLSAFADSVAHAIAR